ncbi:MAG: hypothetical protein JWN45_1809 [Acidobacteriaceae bacterium]|nr:hypothetical protein [Acidobacteriaceae bacterium]
MSDLVQIATAALGIPKPRAYGYVPVYGNLMLQQELADKTRVSKIGLGEGEWDGIERLWVNKKIVDHTDNTQVHFHPGIDGELAHGLAPDSTGGDNRIDTFFNDLPAQLDRVTDSRLATLWLKTPPDPQAPGPELTWLGHYRATKCRIFDAAGNQTAYQFTTVPAWISLDLLINTAIKPDALINEALTAAEKTRIDFPSIVDTAAYHSDVLASGVKRWEASVWFAQRTLLADALTQLMMISRSYMLEHKGKILMYPHKPKASSFIATAKHVLPNGFQHLKSDLRGAPNRLVATYRDLTPKKIVGITSINRVGNVCTLVSDATHPFFVDDDVQIALPATANFAGVFKVTEVPAVNQIKYVQMAADAASAAGGYVGTPESRFTEQPEVLDHDAHALQIGPRTIGGSPQPRRVPSTSTLNFGACTKGQVQRALKFIVYNALGADVTGYLAPWKVNLRCSVLSVDQNDQPLSAQLPGDKFTIDKTISEEMQGDYRITRADITRAGTASDGTQTNASQVELELVKWVDEALTDVADTEQAVVPLPARLGVVPVGVPDANGNLVLPSSTLLNPQGSINPVLMGASGILTVGYDGTGPYLAVQILGGPIPRADGSSIAVPSVVATIYRVWNGAAVLASTAYCMNLVWDVATGATERQEGVGGPASLAFKSMAYRDGKIPITVAAYNTTPAVMAGAGGAGSGGTACFSGNTEVQTIDGDKRFDELPEFPIVLNRRGEPRAARLVKHVGYNGEMRHMGDGELVTPGHPLAKDGQWVPAGETYKTSCNFEGTVYNLEIMDEPNFEEQHYALANGEIAHNAKVS